MGDRTHWQWIEPEIRADSRCWVPKSLCSVDRILNEINLSCCLSVLCRNIELRIISCYFYPVTVTVTCNFHAWNRQSAGLQDKQFEVDIMTAITEKRAKSPQIIQFRVRENGHRTRRRALTECQRLGGVALDRILQRWLRNLQARSSIQRVRVGPCHSHQLELWPHGRLYRRGVRVPLMVSNTSLAFRQGLEAPEV